MYGKTVLGLLSILRKYVLLRSGAFGYPIFIPTEDTELLFGAKENRSYLAAP
jgi:hypothetical protein